MSLAEKRLFLLDMDGTIYLSETLFDGTLEFLRYVRAIGGRYLFLTNNSSRGTDAYIAKMARFGIEAFPDDFLTSADATMLCACPFAKLLSIFIKRMWYAVMKAGGLEPFRNSLIL